MKKTSDLIQFHQTLTDALHQLEMEEEFPNHFYQALLSGENEIYQKNITEIKTFHEDWIGTIESFFPSLDKITKNAKSGLRYDREIVAIEKAKKTNSESVRHLASHTHLIKEIRNGEVIPKKIQITQAEIDMAIYENRFIMTLINRLFRFVMDRHEIVKKNVQSFERKHFNLKSSFKIRESLVEMDLDLNVKDEIEFDSDGRSNYKLLSRIAVLLKQVNGLRESNFMEELKNAKPIIPPIMKTSIILKNVDYNNCYNLWLYLDKYNTFNFDLDVKEQNLPFDKYYLRNVYQTALMTFSTVYANQEELADHYQYIDVDTYKKKAPKFVKKHLKDIINQPDPVVLQDTQINQYYLDQSVEIFKKNLEKHNEESSSYDVALRRALRDTIEITNKLYEQYFEFKPETHDNEMFFARMMKTDTEAEILKAKDKARVARIIRETKEVDYNNAIRLEKRMMKEIQNLDKKLARELKSKAYDLAKKLTIEEKIKIERENLSINQGILEDYLKFVGEQRQVLENEQKEFNEKLKLNAQKVKEEEKAIIENEKKKAKKMYLDQVKKLKTEQRINKKKLSDQLKMQRKMQREKLAIEKIKAKEKSAAKIEKTRQKIQTDYEKKINDAKEKYKIE
ncbi:MAG: hypothetical protein CVV58_00635 [Tenericutes bacterium HGW-Tenericutes-3]|nr:MAG: hypothetical protein CVV58_00635 [Tenericutes bacterium HGW-Tenericutes-3]